MANYFVTYDLERTNPDPHSEFLDQAEKKGWSRWIWGPKSKKWLHLPNTTLVGDFESSSEADKAFDAAVAATAAAIGRSVNVEKFLLGSYSNAIYNSDVRAEPQR